MIEDKEFATLLKDGYFPRKLRSAIEAFADDIPMQ